MDKQEPVAWMPAPCMGIAQNCEWVEGVSTSCTCQRTHPADDGLVERVARAIAAKFSWQPDVYWQDYMVEANAALTALRAQSDAEVERIVAWLNQLGDLWSARQIAAMIERGEHRKDGV